MNLKAKVGLEGIVSLKISGGARGEIQYPPQQNLILDSFLRYLTDQGGSAEIYQVRVGSSSQPTSPTDTGVISPIGGFITRVGSGPATGWNSLDGYGFSRFTFTSARGAAAGNVSELALYDSINGSPAFCRALVLNAEGEPTTITILSDEVLTIVWEIRRFVTFPEPTLITFDDDGTPFQTTVSFSPLIPADTSNAGVRMASGGDRRMQGVSTGDFTTLRTVFFGENSGNPQIANANLVAPSSARSVFPDLNRNNCIFTPPIPKTNEFTVRINFEVSVGRRT